MQLVSSGPISFLPTCRLPRTELSQTPCLKEASRGRWRAPVRHDAVHVPINLYLPVSAEASKILEILFKRRSRRPTEISRAACPLSYVVCALCAWDSHSLAPTNFAKERERLSFTALRLSCFGGSGSWIIRRNTNAFDALIRCSNWRRQFSVTMIME